MEAFAGKALLFEATGPKCDMRSGAAVRTGSSSEWSQGLLVCSGAHSCKCLLNFGWISTQFVDFKGKCTGQ